MLPESVREIIALSIASAAVSYQQAQQAGAGDERLKGRRLARLLGFGR